MRAARTLAALALLCAACGTGPEARPTIIDCGGDEVAAGLAHNGVNLALLATTHTGDRSAWQVIAMTVEGRETWRRQFSQGDANQAGDITFDPTGNLYVTGSGVLEGREMCVIARYRQDGSVAWQRALAVGEACAGRGIALGAERLYVCGWTRNEERRELLIVALDLDGKTVFTRNWRVGATATGERLAVDPQGNLVVTGLAGTAGNPDILLAKLNAKGDTTWTRTYDGGGEDRPGDITADLYGNVIATGTAVTPEGERCVILEYHPDGELIRKAAYGAKATAAGSGVAVTDKGDIIIGGTLLGDRESSLLAFHYLPSATSTWEREWRQGVNVIAADVAEAGNVWVLGTLEKGKNGRDIALVRFTRPVAK